MIKKIPRRIVYSLEPVCSFKYPAPLEYWKNHYSALSYFGYDTVMLFIAGIASVKGFEKTVEWPCDYIPALCEHIQKLGMKVLLMSGVFNWLGMSPGFIRMNPEFAAEWPEQWNKNWSLNSHRRALCSSRSYNTAMQYLQGLWNVYPDADGFALEFGCEKPHCQCDICLKKGHWQIETNLQKEFSEWIWSKNPQAEIVRNLGYQKTHTVFPESQLYKEISENDDPRFLRWYTRPESGFSLENGKKRLFNAEETIKFTGKKGFLHHLPDWSIEKTVNLAYDLGLLGINGHPDERYMFFPEYHPSHFGYLRNCRVPDNPLHQHWLFNLRGMHYKFLFENPKASYDEYQKEIIKNHSCNEETGLVKLTLEKLIIDEKIPAFFTCDKDFYMMKDGLIKDINKAASSKQLKLLKNFLTGNIKKEPEYQNIKETTTAFLKLLS